MKLKKPFSLNDECLWYIRELFRTVEMFMDRLDFDMKPWDIEDPMSININDTLNPIVSVSYNTKLDVLMGLK